MLALCAAFGLSYVSYPHWMLILQPSDEAYVLSRAAQIRAATAPDDLVAIDQGTWSPALLYYADRRGYMIPQGGAAPDGYVVFVCPPPLIGGSGACVQMPAGAL
jgi:hypothetical protein